MKFKIRKEVLNFKNKSYAEQSADENFFKNIITDCSLGINPIGFTHKINEKNLNISRDMIYKYPTVEKEFIKSIINFWKNIVKLKESNIFLDTGTMGICQQVNKMFIDENSKVLGYCPQFSDYIYDVQIQGGTYNSINLKYENNFKFNSNDMLAQLDNSYSLIYIDNPNNPTGQIIPIKTIEEIISEAEEKGIAVLIDEAYGDFMKKENSAIPLVNKYNNLFIARSFSKGFGLAGLRIGYVIISDALSNYYSKITIPFPVSSISQYLAQIALHDNKFIKECLYAISHLKEIVLKTCKKMQVMQTDNTVPIMTLVHPNKKVNLYLKFLEKGIRTTSGSNFKNLDNNSVRLRIPAKIDNVLQAIINIEQEIS